MLLLPPHYIRMVKGLLNCAEIRIARVKAHLMQFKGIQCVLPFTASTFTGFKLTADSIHPSIQRLTHDMTAVLPAHIFPNAISSFTKISEYEVRIATRNFQLLTGNNYQFRCT